MIADSLNDRIVRWRPGAMEGEVVAGGRGSGLHDLSFPVAVAARCGGVLVVDCNNNRVVDVAEGGVSVLAGGARGADCGQFNVPSALVLVVPRTWSPRVHKEWPSRTRAAVRALLLAQSRHGGLASLGELLVVRVLPFAMQTTYALPFEDPEPARVQPVVPLFSHSVAYHLSDSLRQAYVRQRM